MNPLSYILPVIGSSAQFIKEHKVISNANQWAQLELRHLIALQAIAQVGSFGRAAVEIGYTQSAISQQIASLETLVGGRVIERTRGPGPVVLTEMGRLLIQHADAIVGHLRAVQADVMAYHAGEVGQLHIGTYQSVGTRLLPTILRAFAVTWPRINIQLTEDPIEEHLLTLVANGELDLTFNTLPLVQGPFAAVELLNDPWVLLTAHDAPLARDAGVVALHELVGQPMIGYRNCRSTSLLETMLRERGVTLNTVFRSDDNGTVRGLAASGMGAALVPRLALEPDPRIVVRPLPDDFPVRLIGLAWRQGRYRSPAALAFVETALACCHTMAVAADDDHNQKMLVSAATS